MCYDFIISLDCSLWQDFPMDANRFDLVTLTMVFDLLIENFIFEYIFWMVWTRTLIFDISIPCTIVLTLWPWPWCLTYLLKTTTLTIFFEWHLLVGISFECFCDKTFLRVPKDLTLLPQFWCLTLLIEILTLAIFLNGLYKDFYISFVCSILR